ncbi:type II toxin-antitoxin system HicA family toxin [Desulfobaculum senezii]
MNSREIIKKLKAAGFEEVSQKGSHLKLKHPDGRSAVVPQPKKDMPLGTLRNIERTSQVQLT